MAQKKKMPVEEKIGALDWIVERLRLVWALLHDPRVPRGPKLRFILLLGLIISPIDLIPEALVALLGPFVVLDDAFYLYLAFRWLISGSPREVVAEHWARIKGLVLPGRGGETTTEEFIEGEFREV